MPEVKVVKIYLDEERHQVDDILKILHDQIQVKGVTVLRGVSGFGKKGMLKSSRILSLSLSLPLIIEFFDGAQKVKEALEVLAPLVGQDNIIHFSAEMG